MKYKVGDKVRVKSDLSCDIYAVVSDMLRHKDKVFTIVEVSVDGHYYKVNENDWAWTDEMLEPAAIRSVLFPNVEYVFNEKQAKEYADNIMATAESISHITGIPYENSINKLKTCLSAFSNDGISAKNGGKNSMKFTFYVKEGTRPDKKCNGTIPTMTTNIELFDGNVFDKVTTIRGSATCDKTDYDERQGVLEALANAVCGGEFEKRYSKAVKANKDADLIMRTCTYCGKVCDTSEEKIEHEKWHVERRKARHERYKLRKRAKEIAFEQKAQEMAKEMIDAKKGDK